MVTALKFGLVGFFAGIAAALALTMIGTEHVLPSAEVRLLWPTAVFGVEFTDWADGNAWHFLRLLSVFLGNGVVYAIPAVCIGGLIHHLRE